MEIGEVEEANADSYSTNDDFYVSNARFDRNDAEFDEPDAGFDHAAGEFNGADLQGDVENGDSDWPSDHLYRIATRCEVANARCYLPRVQSN